MTQMLGALALVVAVGGLGCGSQPPPAPPTPVGPATWAALAPTPALPPPKLEALKRYQVPHAGALPDIDTLENHLARRGLIADVGGEGDGLAVESQGVRCRVMPAPKLGDDVLPSPRIEPEYVKQGLTEAEAEQLAATTATAEIGCHSSGPPVLAGQVGTQVADALAALLKGFVRDPTLGRFIPPAEWATMASGRHFDVTKHVRVASAGTGDRRAVWTHGLRSFGRAEIALFPVLAADVEPLGGRLLVLADALIQDDAPAAGAETSLGPARMIFLPLEVYAPHFPGAAQPEAEAPVFVVADPKGKPGKPEAVDAVVRRLIAQ